MKKICVMHRASIGDTLLASPIYRAIKQQYSDAKLIAVLSNVGGELLQGNPYIDELITYQKGDSIFKIIKSIWRSDAVIILDYHYRNALLAFLAMIPKRIGRGRDFINIRLTDDVAIEYEPLKYLNLAKAIGVYSENTHLMPIVATDDEKKYVDELLSDNGIQEKRFVTIVPYSMSSLKDWEPDKYREIIKRLNYDGYNVILLGGDKESERIKKEFPQVVSFAGITNLRESAEIISRAKAQLCGCTAMLHICSTTETPVVAIYGPTNPKQWAPRENCFVVSHYLSCSPCYNTGIACRENNRCIKQISVDEVYAKLQEAINR